jgi:hypothetical protein
MYVSKDFPIGGGELRVLSEFWMDALIGMRRPSTFPHCAGRPGCPCHAAGRFLCLKIRDGVCGSLKVCHQPAACRCGTRRLFSAHGRST